MADMSARFGVVNYDGPRSSEWVVMWITNKGDVYLATRVLAIQVIVPPQMPLLAAPATLPPPAW